MSSRTMTLIPDVTPVAPAVEERVCPGAPPRIRRRRRCDSFEEEEQEEQEEGQDEDEEQEDDEPEAQPLDVEVEVEHRPAVRRRLSYACEEAAGEEGVRLLSDVERDCRLLISMAVEDAETDRVYTVVGAFTHFASNKLTDKVYMIEEPAIHVSGYIRLKSALDGEIGVFEAAFLPQRPNNLAFLVEGVNTALVSELPCFAGLKQVYIRLPASMELRNGMFPSVDLPPQFIVDTLTKFHRWGFKAERNVSSACRFEDRVETIDPDNLRLYSGLVKTRLCALWRACNH
jgi:hypothetical protein